MAHRFFVGEENGVRFFGVGGESITKEVTEIDKKFDQFFAAVEDGKLDVMQNIMATIDPASRNEFLAMTDFQWDRKLLPSASDPKIINYLIELGATDEFRKGKYSALHRACSKGDLDLVKRLFAMAPDDFKHDYLNSKIKDRSETPLYLACSKHQWDVAHYLVAKGADIDDGVKFAKAHSPAEKANYGTLEEAFKNHISIWAILVNEEINHSEEPREWFPPELVDRIFKPVLQAELDKPAVDLPYAGRIGLPV